LLLLRIQLLPRGHAAVAGREFGPLGHEARLDLAAEPVHPGLIPSLGEHLEVFLDVLPRCLERGVGRPERELEEEGVVGPEGHVIAQERDRPIGEVLGEVVILAVRSRNGVVVLVQLRFVLVGAAVEESVVAIEPAGEGPVVERAGRGDLVQRREVPFADEVIGVPMLAQDLRQQRDVGPDRPAGAGEPGGGVGEEAHPDRVVVAPREHRGPGGGAQRGDVETAVPQPLVGEPVEVRRRDFRAEAPEVAPPGVIEDDEDDVRPFRLPVHRRGPPRGGFGGRGANLAGERAGHYFSSLSSAGSSEWMGWTVLVAMKAAAATASTYSETVQVLPSAASVRAWAMSGPKPPPSTVPSWKPSDIPE